MNEIRYEIKYTLKDGISEQKKFSKYDILKKIIL